MNRDEYEHMYRLEDSHWWFVARRDLLRRALDRLLGTASPLDAKVDTGTPSARLLDVGCGTGGTLDRLRDYGHVVGLDLEPTALQFCRERGWRSLVYASATSLPFPDASFDAVIALDVLEHIPDHAGALREMARVLSPGGVLLLTVPAYPSLWSGHDVALMHQRRYLLPEVETLLAATPDIAVERLTYTVSALLPVAWTIRRVQRLLFPRRPPRADAAVPVAPWINALLLRLVLAENNVALGRRPVPFGLTIFAAVRKGNVPFPAQNARKVRETVACPPGA